MSVKRIFVAASLVLLLTACQQARAESDTSTNVRAGSSNSSSAAMSPRESRRQQKLMKQQQKIYNKVKNKDWVDLTNKEKKYAQKNGITTEALYNAWKAQQAAVAKQIEVQRQQQIYQKVKDKTWSQLNKREKKFAAQNGIPNEEIYNAWKAEQAVIAQQLQEAQPDEVAAAQLAHRRTSYWGENGGGAKSSSRAPASIETNLSSGKSSR